MSEVLYRKYRPQDLGEIVGQKSVVEVLRASILKNRIAHAYLFSGPAGTGKTPVARFFARAANCLEDSPEKRPCNKCEICKEFFSGVGLDLIEIDAASSRGVDEIRSLREGIRSLPFRAKYKVYIIDEVHMLTTEAFNALLKTLDMIVRKEKIKVDEEILSIISVLASGSLRDAESMLDQALAASVGELEEEEIRKLFGVPARDLLLGMTKAILERDIKSALWIVHKSSEEEVDQKSFLKLLIRNFRFMLYLKIDPAYEKELANFISESELNAMKNFAKENDIKKFETVLNNLNDAYPLLKIAYLQQLPLELAILKIAGQ